MATVYTVFQFLLGRLKTSEGLVISSELIGFQFLLGRLKTGPARPPRKWPARKGFNSC